MNKDISQCMGANIRGSRPETKSLGLPNIDGKFYTANFLRAETIYLNVMEVDSF